VDGAGWVGQGGGVAGERPRIDQRWVISRWLVLLAVAWSVLAVLRWLDDGASAADRWAWTVMALLAGCAAVFGVRAVRRERDRPR
jgi:hypothetical protein